MDNLTKVSNNIGFLAAVTGAEEGMQDSREHFNETGVPIEPFNLDREREEGQFDAGGGYIPNNFP